MHMRNPGRPGFQFEPSIDHAGPHAIYSSALRAYCPDTASVSDNAGPRAGTGRSIILHQAHSSVFFPFLHRHVLEQSLWNAGH